MWLEEMSITSKRSSNIIIASNKYEMVLWKSQEMDGSKKTEISVIVRFILNKNVSDILGN